MKIEKIFPLICAFGAALTARICFDSSFYTALFIGIVFIVLYMVSRKIPRDIARTYLYCLWAVSLWGYIGAITEFLYLRDKPYHIWQSRPAVLVSFVISIAVLLIVRAVTKYLPEAQKQKISRGVTETAKKFRKRSNDPALYKYINEREQLREQYWNRINAGLSFIYDKNAPVISEIIANVENADQAFVSAANEIQFATGKDDIIGWRKQIDSAVNTLGRSSEQIGFYIENLENQQRVDAINNLRGSIRREQAANDNRQQDNNGNNASGDDVNFDFFAGCQTPDEYKKRYRDLMKSYHPDSEAGDAESVKIINEAYDKVRKEKGF